jgi:hypothetical protein
MTNQEILGTLKEYLGRLKTWRGDISPKVLRKEISQVRDDIFYIKQKILSKHHIKNKSYANSTTKNIGG